MFSKIFKVKKFKDHSLEAYLNILSQKTPVPGGGSVAALVGSLGAGLLSMVANYSLGKGSASIDTRIRKILKKSEFLRRELLILVDLDAQAYLKVVDARNKSDKEKKKAALEAKRVSLKVCNLCFQSVQLAPELVKIGNKYLVSDVQVAVELLLAAFNSALILAKI